ncbi:MAG: sigma-54-dependent Fis family transcriptional regulator [Deltaproteobacteria bacterium]|nr:sigma-54-dependent Fis family transcriptional regulator [Deltaproteobacteria bacterium]
MIPFQILVVDDEPNSLFGICQVLTDEGYKVIPTDNGKEALEKLKADSVNLIITDEKMSGLSGMELLTEAKKMDPQIPVIMITAYGSVSLAVEALKRGAFYFFEKPIFNNLERFLIIIRQALKTQEMERELNHLRKEVSEKYSFPNIIGRHLKMLEIFEIIGRVAKTDRTILIQGESGTGKDLIAKTIHYNSIRKDKPLVTVNCGALTDTLLTSELFGHTKGAFTGAIKDKVGRFQMAHEGTLILDEIGEVPLYLQKTLLRVIEEKEFERVGESKSTKVDVRILCTTNRNLEEEVKKGNFREDLYYRLSIVPITVPPLRERASDIPLLVNHFLKKFQEGQDPIRIEPKALEQLKTYPWYGNIRELANVVQQMMIFCTANVINLNDLPPRLFLNESDVAEEAGQEIQLTNIVSELEKKWIFKKLTEVDWNQEKAAKLLGITRKMLTKRMKKYHLEKVGKKYIKTLAL